MNLEEALSQILLNTNDKVMKATDFIINELPDVIQQLLRWNMVESLICCCVGIIGLILCVIFTYKMFYKLIGNDELYEHPEITLLILIIFPVIACIKIINLNWLQIWLAPKLYLIEYAKTFIK